MDLSEISMLHIDDDETFRGLLSSLLTAKYPSISICSADSAEEGLTLFKRHHQSIIMTDINLPDSDGIQMARAIRILKPDTAVIFMSGSADVERLIEFLGDATCHYICKPVDFNELVVLLDRCIQTFAHTK